MSNDDIVSRSAEFERKVSAAGSTEGIVTSLVKGAERSRQVVKWLTVSLVLDIILSLTLGTVGIVALHNAKAIKAQTRHSCSQTNKNSTTINSFLNLLIVNTQTSTLLTPAEKAQRVKGYQARIIKIPDCH